MTEAMFDFHYFLDKLGDYLLKSFDTSDKPPSPTVIKFTVFTIKLEVVKKFSYTSFSPFVIFFKEVRFPPEESRLQTSSLRSL